MTEPTTETRTPFVQPICALFAQALGRARIGPSDNFFILGGDSLAVADLALLLEDNLNVQVTDLDILEHPTPVALACFILQNSGQIDDWLARLPDDEIALLSESLLG